MPRLRRTVWVGVIALLAVAFGYLALTSRETSLAQVRQRGVIRVGYAVEAPYAYVDDGRVIGESPDVATRVVHGLGIPKIAWVQTTFDRLIPELIQGRFDVIAAGMFITDDRRHQVAFSQATFLVRQALLVKRGNPLALHAYDDLAASDSCRVAVVASAFERDLLLQAGVPDARIIQVPDSLTGRVAVESGLVDALALSTITINWLARGDALGRTEVATPFSQPTRGHGAVAQAGAFAFRQGDTALREAWDTELSRFAGSDEHLRLIAPYGFTRAELPPTAAGPQS